ncbi:hypothetical protein BD779DRAFT_591208 [Infundibulicybe gibba]|nr:hypothetical protein BD779DRAFT_591208 [Infundibulicybe gibba]
MALLVFPSSALQVLSLLVHFLGLAVLTYCLSQRLALSTVSPLNGPRQLSWPRLCVILIFLDSWLFMFSSGILIFGVGMETTEGACSAAIALCIAFYATSKIFIYLFLAEKVYIVWSPAMGARRFKSPIYLICFVTISIYTVIIALMVAGRIYFQRPGDGACVVGLEHFSSIPLLTFDLYINILFTALFLWPLLRIQVLNLRVKSVAMRTLMAASVALTTSTANLVILAVLNGQELGWICLGSCAGDVIVNALAIFWVTSGSGGHPTQSSAGGPIPVDLRFTQFSRGLDVPVSDQAGRHTPFDHQSTSRSVSNTMLVGGRCRHRHQNPPYY